MNRKRIIILLITCALLCTSCALIPKEEQLPAAPRRLSSQKNTYTMVEVARGDILNFFPAKCLFQAAEEENLSFSIYKEPIGQIFVNKDDVVTAGTLIAELECSQLKEQVAQQQQLLELTQLQVTQGEELLGLYYERCSALDDAVAADPSYSGMSSSAEKICLRHYNELELLRRQLEIEQATLDRLQEQLSLRQIYAGMDGTVTFIQSMPLDPQEQAMPARVVCTIADLSSCFFSTQLPKYVIAGAKLKVGDTLDLSFTQGIYSATVTSIEPADKDDFMYTVIMEPSTATVALPNHSSGSIDIIIDERKDVLWLPAECVDRLENNTVVYCLDEKGVRYAKSVEIGLVAANKAEIISGLEEGELVIK